jgi:phosphatidylglycerophosphate synthase
MENYLFGRFITKDGLDNIKNHKYKSGGYSFLDNIMNPFWEWVVKLMPETLAPNSITLLGLVINLSMYFFMFLFDHTLTQIVPWWTYVGFGVGLFMYQTLDAIDGKQARRTGSSSPLGQLFDHGCDTLSCAMVVLALVHTLQLGIAWKSKLIIGSLFTPFYLAQMAEYKVGVVFTQIGNIGVTEGQFGQIFIMIIAGIFGGGFYDMHIADFHASFKGVIPDWIEISDVISGFLILNSIFFGLTLFTKMMSTSETLGEKIKVIWY